MTENEKEARSGGMELEVIEGGMTEEKEVGLLFPKKFRVFPMNKRNQQYVIAYNGESVGGIHLDHIIKKKGEKEQDFSVTVKFIAAYGMSLRNTGFCFREKAIVRKAEHFLDLSKVKLFTGATEKTSFLPVRGDEDGMDDLLDSVLREAMIWIENEWWSEQANGLIEKWKLDLEATDETISDFGKFMVREAETFEIESREFLPEDMGMLGDINFEKKEEVECLGQYLGRITALNIEESKTPDEARPF